jgi:endoplasmic reticulum lectin 1
MLGFFNEDKHKEWVKTKPEEKAKLRTQNQIVNFYSGGDFCDLSQAPRNVEVRLKCVDKPLSPSAVAIYLNEPRPCEYVLHVESSMICDLIPLADENMIIPKEADDDEETTQTLYLIGKNVND